MPPYLHRTCMLLALELGLKELKGAVSRLQGRIARAVESPFQPGLLIIVVGGFG